MGEAKRSDDRSGERANEHATAQRRRGEAEHRQAKRLSRESHHDGRVADDKRSR